MTREILKNDSRETAVVTGGGSGIGRATAIRLAQDGFRVLVVDRDAKALAGMKAGLDGALAITCHEVDVCDRLAMCRLLDDEARLDVMVCAAGIGQMLPFDAITDQDFRAMLEVNLLGVFIGAQEASRRMKAGGRIVTISSRAAIGGGGFAHYVAAKAGVVGLTRAMAIDLRGKSIAVNSVAPGFTETGITRALTPEQHAKFSALEPSGHPADPAEIANAVSFLASPKTSFITGQTLFVDGGKSVGSLLL